MGLVDKAIQAEREGLAGQACIDRRFGGMNAIEDIGYGAGDWDLHQAAEMLQRAGVPVVEDARAKSSAQRRLLYVVTARSFMQGGIR